ncbi:hypothetical protein ACFQ9X_37465 [Catenulispora yoronensis]
MALAGGADLQIVKERLGHGSITTTEQYLGTLPGAGDAALSALDAIRGARTPADLQAEPSTAKEGTPDMAELMKMMASIKDTYERLAS